MSPETTVFAVVLGEETPRRAESLWWDEPSAHERLGELIGATWRVVPMVIKGERRANTPPDPRL